MNEENGTTPTRRGGFRVFKENSRQAEEVVNQLLPDPDRALEGGEPLVSPWRSEATDKARIVVGGKNYFLKRYNCRGWLYRLKNGFRRSKAVHSWTAGQTFRAHGIATVEPLVCLEERFGNLLGRSYLVFPFRPDTWGNLLEVWPHMSRTTRSRALAALAQLIGRMHRAGATHGDLNWRNILVCRRDERLEYFLVDLDGSRMRKKLRADQARKDLDHFLRDLDRNEVDTEDQQRFLAQWRRVAENAS